MFTSAHYGGLSLDDTSFDFVIAPAAGVTLEEAEAALDEIMANFLEEGIEPGHLDRIKMQVRASQIYARDSVSQLANRYGRALTQGLTVEDVQAWPGILQAVTEEDVMQAAREVFNRDRAVTGWLMAPEVTQ